MGRFLAEGLKARPGPATKSWVNSKHVGFWNKLPTFLAILISYFHANSWIFYPFLAILINFINSKTDLEFPKF
jgi:hypothetical protein